MCKQKKKPPGSGKVGALKVDYDSLNTLTGCISGDSQVAKMVEATIDGCNITWLVDSGYPYTMISEKRAKSISLSWNKVATDDKLQSATGSMLSEFGRRKCRMHLRGRLFDIEVGVISNLEFNALLGRDSLTQFSEVTLKTGGKGPSLVLSIQQSKTKVESIVKAYAGCFDKSLKDSQLKIEPEPIIDLTNDTVPIRCPTRRYSDADRKVIHETVTSLIKNGIIEESTSEWRSQPVIVSKRGGSKRMAIDFSCTTNKFSKLDAFPVPLISDLVQRVSRYNCFSVVDITQAYYQVPLVQEDMEKKH